MAAIPKVIPVVPDVIDVAPDVKSKPARVNPQLLPTPSALYDAKIFQTPAGDDVLIRLGYVTDSSFFLAIQSRAQEFETLYITGKNGGLPAPLRPYGGRVVEMSSAFCSIVAGLEKMHKLGDPDNAYDFDDWCAWSINAPDVFNGASLLANALQESAYAVSKNV